MTTIWKSRPAVRLIAYVLGVSSGLGCSQPVEVSKVSAAETAVLPGPEAPVSQIAQVSQVPGPPDAAVPISEPNLNGTWAMFDFEDPVVATLVQDGKRLTGRGCCAPGGDDALCCGDIVGGMVADGRLLFEFPVLGTQSYRTLASVSAAGDRMTGTFDALAGLEFVTAWVRLPHGQIWLRHDDAALSEAATKRINTFVISLTEGDGSEFAFDTELELILRVTSNYPMLRGALGAFWGGEMVWREDDETLVVGPVPATQPDLPIALELHFADRALQSVDAWMPSGNHYAFAAVGFSATP